MPDENTSPPPDDVVGVLHKRIDQVEEFVKHLVEKVERLISSARPVVDAVAGTVEQLVPGSAPALHAVQIVVDAVPCPDHPEAPQSVNGCTAPGCMFYPGNAR